MARRALIVVALAVATVSPAPAQAHRHGCTTRACDARILHRDRRASWARRHPWQHYRNELYRRAPWLRGTLARLRGCETRGLRYPTNYRVGPLYPRYNGHDGAYQYDRPTWASTLGYLPPPLRRRATRGPAYMAPPAEQDVRTARFYPTHRGQWACSA